MVRLFTETIFTTISFFLKAFADALLVIPKILAQNSGYDPQETIVKLQVIKTFLKKKHFQSCNDPAIHPLRPRSKTLGLDKDISGKVGMLEL